MKYLGKITDPKDLITKEYVDENYAVMNHTHSAVDIGYDNEDSGLTANSVQAALDELSSEKVNVAAQAAKTEDMTQAVGVDSNGKLWTKPGGASKIVCIVTCTARDGNPVSGPYVVVKEKTSGTEYSRTQYLGQPVSVEMPDGFMYRIEMQGTSEGHYAPTPAYIEGLATVNFAYNVEYKALYIPETLDDLADIIRSGGGQQLRTKLVAGQLFQFPDQWTADDELVIDDPWDLADIRDVVDEDGITHEAAILIRHYCAHYNVVFDAEELNLEATEEAAQAGLYYYGKNGSTWTDLVLSEGDTIPYDDYEHVYKNFVKDTTHGIRYGYNRWSHSFIRQYLNSAGLKGTYWNAQHVGDVAPGDANDRHGYMHGCSAKILSLAKPIKISTALNTITLPDKNIGAYEETVDTFWLPSGTEMYGSINSNEGTFFPLVKNNTGLTSPNNGNNTGRIYYRNSAHSSARYCWVRSPGRGDSNHAWNVGAGGNLYGGTTANDSCTPIPACAIF